MDKLWAGRTSSATAKIADDFNSSIAVDSRMYAEDIRASIAHAEMLGKCGIISCEDSEAIKAGLAGILADITAGSLEIDMTAEDIHMFVEAELTRRIGDCGKRLHTARSRNDQVAIDVRMYLRGRAETVDWQLRELIGVLCDKADESKAAIMPGYTHLQRAQPVTFAQHMLAYCAMLMRDCTRLADCVKRMNLSPLGACALAGTTYNIDREMTAASLGFDAASMNSMDSVSDRDFCVESCSCLAMIMMHLSRLSEELILWSSWEFKFIELDDAYTTGSSIMPQKKNPDMAELIRGKTGRVYGSLTTLLTMLKGLPLAYNKDMQEDKQAVFDAFDTVEMCLRVAAPMINTMKILPENMRTAAQRGFINATDLADYLTKKGMPFRSAYKLTGQIVKLCMERSLVLETLPLDEYKGFSQLFSDDLYAEISLEACVAKRISAGGVGEESVKAQISAVRDFLK